MTIEQLLTDILGELKTLNGKKGKDRAAEAAKIVEAVKTAVSPVDTTLAVTVEQAEKSPDNHFATAVADSPALPVTKVYTQAEVGKALTDLCEKKTALLNGDKQAGFAVGRGILDKFGAAKVGMLDAKLYPQVMAEIEKAGK